MATLLTLFLNSPSLVGFEKALLEPRPSLLFFSHVKREPDLPEENSRLDIDNITTINYEMRAKKIEKKKW